MTLGELRRRRDWRLWLALGGGAGLAPRAPGTAGTAVGAVLFWGLAAMGAPAAVLAGGGVAAVAVGVHLCAYAERVLGRADDGRIVWDEAAAFFALLAFLPASWGWGGQVAAFAVFRFLDAVKPFPIGWVERRVRGGGGIVLDDVLAAGGAFGVVYGAFVVLGRMGGMGGGGVVGG